MLTPMSGYLGQGRGFVLSKQTAEASSYQVAAKLLKPRGLVQFGRVVVGVYRKSCRFAIVTSNRFRRIK